MLQPVVPVDRAACSLREGWSKTWDIYVCTPGEGVTGCLGECLCVFLCLVHRQPNKWWAELHNHTIIHEWMLMCSIMNVFFSVIVVGVNIRNYECIKLQMKKKEGTNKSSFHPRTFLLSALVFVHEKIISHTHIIIIALTAKSDDDDDVACMIRVVGVYSSSWAPRGRYHLLWMCIIVHGCSSRGSLAQLQNISLSLFYTSK